MLLLMRVFLFWHCRGYWNFERMDGDIVANTDIVKRAFSPQPARETGESARNLFHSHPGTDSFIVQSLNLPH